MDIIPPMDNMRDSRENNRRMALETLSAMPVATFMTDESARNFAKEYQLDEDAVAKLLVASRGNHETIRDFMARLRSDKSKKGGIDLLQQISAKDLRDVSSEVLIDHMMNSHLAPMLIISADLCVIRV